MIDKPDPTAQFRSRAPDTAADLGLYAAPIALAVPALALAAEPASAAAAPAPLPAGNAAPAGLQPADWAPAFGWGSDQQAVGGVLAATVVPTPELKMQVAAAEPAAEKHVVVHVAPAAPPSAVPVSQIEPVARTEAEPAQVQLAAAGTAAEAGAPATTLTEAQALNGQLLNLAAADAPSPAGTVGALTGTVTTTVGALAETVTGTVADLAGTTTELVADLVETVVPLVGDTLETVVPLVGNTLGAATDLLAPAVETVTGLVGGTLDGLLDIVGPLGGSDPVGGITTLVGLVSAEDVFGPPAAGSEPIAALDPIADTVDGLLGGLLGTDGDAPHDVLLGVADPHHGGALGLLGHLTDDPI